jgi:integrase/recombinase XerD
VQRDACAGRRNTHLTVTAVRKGISLLALQRLLGHDRLTTTEIYLNLSPEEEVREFREKW